MQNINDTLYSEATDEVYFADYDWIGDIEGAVAELSKWVESGGVEAIGPAGGEY